jgi:predicted nucleic acid-binding protein
VRHNTERHGRAQETWNKLKSAPYLLVTSSLVVAETVTVLARESSYEEAYIRGRELLSSSEVKILRPTLSEEIDALERLKRFGERIKNKRKRPNYVDCACFATMDAHGIATAFTFDEHFRTSGFDVIPAISS